MSLIAYLFYAAFAIAFLRLSLWFFLSSIYNLKRRTVQNLHLQRCPRISIIVPAYNEEVTIERCLQSLLDLVYSNYEIIVVDDGSTDKTLDEARKFNTAGVRVIHQENQGKSNALNNGIRSSTGEIVVTVDADTRLHREALEWIALRFAKDAHIGAVEGNVKVDPSVGLLNVLQATEYTTAINLFRKAQSMLGCVMIVPGPIAALSRKAVESVGFFSDDTFAEDFDVTMKILKAGYIVEYEERAVAFTDAPKNLEDLMKQRRRWYRGMIQVLDKHRNMYLRRKYGLVGMFGVPHLWFNVTSAVLNITLIFLALLAGLLVGKSFVPLFGILTYFGLELGLAIYAILLDPMPKKREIFTAPLLLFYNIFLDGVRMMALAEEMVGILMEWEKPRRYNLSSL